MKIDDCFVAAWNQWSKRATKLQVLCVDAKNQKKANDNYKMKDESIITIQEELFDDLIALAETQIEVVRKLLDGLEDDQLDVRLQFKGYEREQRPKGA